MYIVSILYRDYVCLYCFVCILLKELKVSFFFVTVEEFINYVFP